MRHCLFHDARRLDDLGQEHLAAAEQVTHHVHAVHQRPLDDIDRPAAAVEGLQPRFLGIFDDERIEALYQRMFETLRHRQLAPRLGGFFGDAAIAAKAIGNFQQTIGRIGPAIEDDILAGLAQFGIDGVIDIQLPSIDDRHVEPGRDRMEEENRMHRAAHRLVAAEGKTQVRQTTRNMGVRAPLANLAARLDEIDAVVVMLLDTRRHREDIGIKDDVLRRKAVGDEQLIGTFADFDLAGAGIGLPLFVERHNDNGRAIALHLGGLFEETRFAFLHADRIDDRLARNAFQAGFDHAPFRTVDHHGHAGDIGLGSDQLEEGRHGMMGIEQPLVHVDVKNLRAAFDLLARDFDRSGIIARHDQLLEPGRPGDVGPFADVDERRTCGWGHEIRPRESWDQVRSIG